MLTDIGRPHFYGSAEQMCKTKTLKWYKTASVKQTMRNQYH